MKQLRIGIDIRIRVHVEAPALETDAGRMHF